MPKALNIAKYFGNIVGKVKVEYKNIKYKFHYTNFACFDRILCKKITLAVP